MGFGKCSLEGLGMTAPMATAGTQLATFWKGKHVFVTGHTGFKGGWLSLWLQHLGARVTGYALTAPPHPSLFDEAQIADGMVSCIGDIRDLDTLRSIMKRSAPEIVLHLAAQPLVRPSYTDPVMTYATNVMGTVHVLEAARACPQLRAIVNVTTDKCYDNREWVWGYRENDPVGGHDPYSSSKGCSELITAAYRRSFFTGGAPALASARAGNVIGGGDWASDRLVPDVLRAFARGEAVSVRHPAAVRPWQHVLEPVSGYLMLAERLWNDGQSVAEAFNFGPRDEDAQSVRWIVERLATRWGASAHWTQDSAQYPHEATLLKLDISKARCRLGWEPRWDLATALDRTLDWHRAWLSRTPVRDVCVEQIRAYQLAMDARTFSEVKQ